MHTLGLRDGHRISLQSLPGHSGIQGNVVSDAAAKEAHNLLVSIGIPYSRQDGSTAVNTLGWKLQLSAWQDPLRIPLPLPAIDPQCNFQFPRGLQKQTDGVLHRLRLNVAFTGSFLFKIGWADSQLCSVCSVREDIRHVFCYCPQHTTQRETAKRTLVRLLRRNSLELRHFLGPWQNHADAARGTKALLTFLSDTGLTDVF